MVDPKATLHVNAVLPREERNTHPGSWIVSFVLFVNKWCFVSICITLWLKSLSPFSGFFFIFWISAACYFWSWLIAADHVILQQAAEGRSTNLPTRDSYKPEGCHFPSPVPYGPLPRFALWWQQGDITQRVLRRSCPSSYFLAPEGTILGLSGDKYMIWYEYIYLLLYSAYEADCRTAFCKLGVNTCPSIHRSAGLPSVLIRKENGERGQIMPGLGRTKGCREFLILESRWSDLDTENRKFCYLHMHTLPGSEEYLQLERFPDFIVFSQLKTVTVECTACCHEPDKSTSSRVLGRLGTCLLE